MPHSRYTVADAYVIEELKRRYESADGKGRIQLLRSIYRKQSHLPYDLALLAVEDSNVEVRQWIARYGGYLDYSEHWPEKTTDSWSAAGRYPEKNLKNRLQNDLDSFVRACLRENPRIYSVMTNWKARFEEATHLERLALVRNPFVGKDLIERLFDPDDGQLNIPMEQRKELIAAFLTNSEALNLDQGDRTKLGDKIWPLAFKWPLESRMPADIIWYVPAGDQTKATVYRSCQDPRFREAILEHCTPDDVQTVALGMKDVDENCRAAAKHMRSARTGQQRELKPYRNLAIVSYLVIFGYPVITWLFPFLKASERTERYVLAMFALLFLYKVANQTTKSINATYEKAQSEYKTLKTEIADLREDAGEWCGFCRGWGRVRCFCVFGHAGAPITDEVQ